MCQIRYERLEYLDRQVLARQLLPASVLRRQQKNMALKIFWWPPLQRPLQKNLFQGNRLSPMSKSELCTPSASGCSETQRSLKPMSKPLTRNILTLQYPHKTKYDSMTDLLDQTVSIMMVKKVATSFLRRRTSTEQEWLKKTSGYRPSWTFFVIGSRTRTKKD